MNFLICLCLNFKISFNIEKKSNEVATFEVIERKTTTGMRESELKKEFLTYFYHSKPNS